MPSRGQECPRHTGALLTRHCCSGQCSLHRFCLSLRGDSEFGVEFGGFVEDSVFDDQLGLADVADVFGRVAVDKNQVGQFAGSDRTQVFIHAHDFGGTERRVLENLGGGDAGLVVEFEFVKESESCHGVGAGFDLDSRAIEKAGEVHHLGEGFPVGVIHAGRRSEALGEQAAADLRGETAGDGLKADGDLAGTAHELIFEDAESEIELGVVILQELDEGLDLRRVEVEASRDFSGLDEAGDGVGVFDLGKEVEDEEIDVLDFVVAEFDALGGGHFGGNVPADP